jgi:hypothetical protein
MGALYKKLLGKQNFRQNGLGDFPAFLKGVDEFLPLRPIFLEHFW